MKLIGKQGFSYSGMRFIFQTALNSLWPSPVLNTHGSNEPVKHGKDRVAVIITFIIRIISHRHTKLVHLIFERAKLNELTSMLLVPHYQPTTSLPLPSPKFLCQIISIVKPRECPTGKSYSLISRMTT